MMSQRQGIVSSYLQNEGEIMPLENQVEWETLVFQLIMHKIQEELGPKGSVKLVKSALDLSEGCLIHLMYLT